MERALMGTDVKIVIVIAVIAGLLGGAAELRKKSSPSEVWGTVFWYTVGVFVIALIIGAVIEWLATSHPQAPTGEDPDFCTVNVC